MINFYIYLAVFVCGASVLALEIVGTRVIGPFYGVSLYLWSALISVTLAALSLGYAVGGRLADRQPTMKTFALIIGLAGLWITIIPWLRLPVLASAESLGLRAAVLVTATILFFLPLALLGMVSPYAIRLKAASLDVVGRTAGNLYALSTVASVVAAVGTGFFLIPNIGVDRLIFLIGVLLMATSLAGFLSKPNAKSSSVITLIVLIVGCTLGYLVAPVQAADPENGLIEIRQSAYAEIRVIEQEGIRYMTIDGGTHTIVDPNTWESFFPYVSVLDITKKFFTHQGEMLLVGLGGGSVAKNFANNNWAVDAVEIDPVVTEVAYEFFGLKESEATVYEMDGRQYLNNNDKSYDIIIMDAFGSSSIPFHLVTTEAFALIRSRLKAEGIMGMNIEAVGWDDEIVPLLVATMKEQFANVVVLPIAEPPDQLGNLIILAADRTLELGRELDSPTDRFSPEYNQTHAWDNRFTPEYAGIKPLTDDLNHIDLIAERINLVAREGLHQYFDRQGISW